MRRAIIMALLGLVLATSGGCFAFTGNTIRARRQVARHPLIIDGEPYVVDVDSGEVMRLPAGAVEKAGPFQPVEEEDEDD